MKNYSNQKWNFHVLRLILYLNYNIGLKFNTKTQANEQNLY